MKKTKIKKIKKIKTNVCKNCGSEMVVGVGRYRRCLSCYACYTAGERITDTPKSFRI